jgi:hypothetical protein
MADLKASALLEVSVLDETIDDLPTADLSANNNV